MQSNQAQKEPLWAETVPYADPHDNHFLQALSMIVSSILGIVSFILIYLDDTIIAGPILDRVKHVIPVLSSLFNVEDLGNISNYLGV